VSPKAFLDKHVQQQRAPFHERLRTLRLTRGLSQAGLGRKAQVGTNTVAALERGERLALPQTVGQLAAALGVVPGELEPERG
jgi:transcriptional regulator with XRE-family HTH domain